MTPLLVEKFSDGEGVAVAPADGAIRVEIGTETYELSRADAVSLRDDLADALAETLEFVHTVGTHRPDGAYVVERRRASSAGHRKVFDAFRECVALYDRLPREFTAADVGGVGLTGGRRHVLVHHFVEHPAFACDLVSKQPLTARKRRLEDDTAAAGALEAE